MADTKTSALTVLTTPAASDTFPVYDATAAELKQIAHADLCRIPSFTPVISDAPSGGNDSPTSATYASCLILGKLMFINILFSGVDTSGMTGGNDVFITGLPETVNGAQLGSAGISHTSLSGNVNAAISNSVDYFRIAEFSTSGGAVDYMVVSELSTGVSSVQVTAVFAI